jgi:hypothetical protein
MRRLRALLLAGAVLLVAAPPPSSAQEAEPTQPPPPTELAPVVEPTQPEFTLVADEVTYDGERDIYEATGNVRITQADGRVLTTDGSSSAAPRGPA